METNEPKVAEPLSPESIAGKKTPPPSEPSNHGRQNHLKKDRVRYRMEWLHPVTNEVLYHRYTDTPDRSTLHVPGKDDNIEQPAFELVTAFRAKLSKVDQKKKRRGSSSSESSSGSDSEVEMKKGQEKINLALSTQTKPSYTLKIYSVAIINALQAVVQYYPGEDLSGDSVSFRYPYPLLVHHYDELSLFSKRCQEKPVSELCVRERDAALHIRLLLDFLDTQVMSEVRAEKQRNKQGLFTYEFFWVAMRPGSSCLMKLNNEWEPKVVSSVDGGTFADLGSGGWIKTWTIKSWSLAYDGRYLGRVSSYVKIGKWDGETDRRGSLMFVEQTSLDGNNDRLDPIVKEQIARGREYWQLLAKQCKYYKGQTGNFPYNEVDSLVMVDMKAFYSQDVTARSKLPFQERGPEPPELLIEDDCRSWTSDCDCSVCRTRKAGKTLDVLPLFADYHHISPESRKKPLTTMQYMLCPRNIYAFVFRARSWELLRLGSFQPPNFEEDLIEKLVMNDGRKRTIKALAKSFARENKASQQLTTDLWSADFVKGKGNGLIFLLHGMPGVGKTCTAECIAAFTKRPLLVLTASDIGMKPADVEYNLSARFKLAKAWDAVLLIDEADVFMEYRSTSDLQRNGLVASFLRALENFDGILFLTTNRVGTFDDAFMSRVHVKMYYPPFTDDQREEVWKTFMDRLVTERGDTLRLNIDAKDYLRSRPVKEIKWNGRDIRNAFQTAVALAEYDAEKDSEGKVLVTDKHFRAVVELSQDFQNYLDTLHRGDEAKRSERKKERLDDISRGPSTLSI